MLLQQDKFENKTIIQHNNNGQHIHKGYHNNEIISSPASALLEL